MGAIEAKKWELVTWNGVFYAVGLEPVRGNLNVLTFDRSKAALLAGMKLWQGWEPKPAREDVYDVDRAKSTGWDGRKDRPGGRRKRY